MFATKKVQGVETATAVKIFRPWDMREAKVQDDIISTTTSEEQTTTTCSASEEVSTAKKPETCYSETEIALKSPSRLDNAVSGGGSKVLKSFRRRRRADDGEAVTKRTKKARSDVKQNVLDLDFEGGEQQLAASAFRSATSAVGAPESRSPFSQQHYEHQQLSSPLSQDNYPLGVYPAEYLAHSLGLAATDPLFLESMAHGYAMEEYARILNEEHQAKLMSGRKQRPKKYRCPHCDVGFSNNGQLKGHIRIHTGERPFKCDEKNCGKTFTRNEELTRHKRIHSGLRPFPCTHCGKRFGRKDHLKKHSRTHLQPRALYAALPVMLPAATLEAAAAACYHAAAAAGYPGAVTAGYPIPMYGY